MLKSVQFLITIIIILSVQISFYSSFLSFIEGSPLDKQEIAELKQKVSSAQAELQMVQIKFDNTEKNSMAARRSIASVDKIDMSAFYFSRTREFKKLNQFELALRELNKISNETTDQEFLAKAEYEKTEIICAQKIEAACVTQMEALVTQFPETVWAGRGLLILSEYYFRQNRQSEGASLLKILKQQFNKFNDVSAEVKNIERRYL